MTTTENMVNEVKPFVEYFFKLKKDVKALDTLMLQPSFHHTQNYNMTFFMKKIQLALQP